MTKNRQWRLARRPRGTISEADFSWAEEPVPSVGEGQFLVRNLYLSMDPTQRGWMSRDTYIPAMAIGDVVRSFGVGQVVGSRRDGYRPGEIVQGGVGWQDYLLTDGSGPLPISKLPAGVDIPLAMSVLGLTGITAYFGLLEVGRPRAGETLVVSGAAGATGSVVGQVGKIHGCRVVGIAGGPEKCAWLTDEAGFDAVIDYRAERVDRRLGELCPDGIDLFFDNVGGEILDAALAHLAMRGRVVICGAISAYNEKAPPPGPRNYLSLLVQRGRMEGFIILDYMDRAGEAVAALSQWVQEGKLRHEEDIQEGLENAPATLNRLFEGKNRGKQLLKIADPPMPLPVEQTGG
ncbi:MAG: NADP-dependent oxidoreductase [Acidobacteria bacterium]|jgi:NADPH-dependent curcumin reductase CurA|nr:NADP-dependent oxidoreductase [Acidobacteriota bacterium]